MTGALVELLAAVFGLSGALWLAVGGRRAGWGFALFLASNVLWMAFALRAGHVWLLVQYAGFLLSSLIGCWVWLVRPALEARAAAAVQGLDGVYGGEQ